jgi:glutamate/tyrosine decarboxylase-like PLP-dependent enzyme
MQERQMTQHDPCPESLDPQDWPAFRELAHRAVDDMLDHVQQIRERPVWQAAPAEVVAQFRRPLPRAPQGAVSAYEDFRAWVQPWQMGNTHPRFWGWFMGNGTPFGALAEYLAATLNPNMGGGNHIGNHVELQVIDWCREMMGMPAGTGGLLVSGGSMANLVGLAVARTAGAGIDVRRLGVAAIPAPLRFYASTEVHSCMQKALELMGHGAESLVKLPVDEHYRLRIDLLAARIAADRAAGLKPCAVIGSAGTINTGAVDDLAAIADLCRSEGLWFHVDGAIGAVLAISSRHRAQVAGIERADSVALDLHKWLHMPFEAGCALVRDAERHRDTFALTPAYLKHAERGIAAGAHWFSDYGIQLSRGFKALKIWLSLKEHGSERFARMIERNVEQAQALGELIRSEPELELMAPVPLDIVCFRYRSAGRSDTELDALNEELLIRLHESGVAVPSYTTLHGRYCIRVAICNHRTRDDDLRLLVAAVVAGGRALS